MKTTITNHRSNSIIKYLFTQIDDIFDLSQNRSSQYSITRQISNRSGLQNAENVQNNNANPYISTTSSTSQQQPRKTFNSSQNNNILKNQNFQSLNPSQIRLKSDQLAIIFKKILLLVDEPDQVLVQDISNLCHLSLQREQLIESQKYQNENSTIPVSNSQQAKLTRDSNVSPGQNTNNNNVPHSSEKETKHNQKISHTQRSSKTRSSPKPNFKIHDHLTSDASASYMSTSLIDRDHRRPSSKGHNRNKSDNNEKKKNKDSHVDKNNVSLPSAEQLNQQYNTNTSNSQNDSSNSNQNLSSQYNHQDSQQSNKNLNPEQSPAANFQMLQNHEIVQAIIVFFNQLIQLAENNDDTGISDKNASNESTSTKILENQNSNESNKTNESIGYSKTELQSSIFCDKSQSKSSKVSFTDTDIFDLKNLSNLSKNFVLLFLQIFGETALGLLGNVKLENSNGQISQNFGQIYSHPSLMVLNTMAEWIDDSNVDISLIQSIAIHSIIFVRDVGSVNIWNSFIEPFIDKIYKEIVIDSNINGNFLSSFNNFYPNLTKLLNLHEQGSVNLFVIAKSSYVLYFVQLLLIYINLFNDEFRSVLIELRRLNQKEVTPDNATKSSLDNLRQNSNSSRNSNNNGTGNVEISSKTTKKIIMARDSSNSEGTTTCKTDSNTQTPDLKMKETDQENEQNLIRSSTDERQGRLSIKILENLFKFFKIPDWSVFHGFDSMDIRQIYKVISDCYVEWLRDFYNKNISPIQTNENQNNNNFSYQHQISNQDHLSLEKARQETESIFNNSADDSDVSHCSDILYSDRQWSVNNYHNDSPQKQQQNQPQYQNNIVNYDNSLDPEHELFLDLLNDSLNIPKFAILNRVGHRNFIRMDTKNEKNHKPGQFNWNKNDEIFNLEPNSNNNNQLILTNTTDSNKSLPKTAQQENLNDDDNDDVDSLTISDKTGDNYYSSVLAAYQTVSQDNVRIQLELEESSEKYSTLKNLFEELPAYYNPKDATGQKRTRKKCDRILREKELTSKTRSPKNHVPNNEKNNLNSEDSLSLQRKLDSKDRKIKKLKNTIRDYDRRLTENNNLYDEKIDLLLRKKECTEEAFSKYKSESKELISMLKIKNAELRMKARVAEGPREALEMLK